MFSYFVFFFISGFCGILYELIWLRLAMAQFGVTTALVSLVLSSFMAGLGIGSFASGWLIRRAGDKVAFPALRFYAVTELLIACSALAVPAELVAGHHLLAHAASSTTFSSGQYYLWSGAWIALTFIPWCACMGATIPFGMLAIRCNPCLESRRSFSFLYLANVVGAALGGVLPLLLIELWGFHATLRLGAILNCTIGISAFAITLVSRRIEKLQSPLPSVFATVRANKLVLVLLFMTGFASMGMEVAWIRMFTPFLGVMVYSFGTILVVYLFATFLGSHIYRTYGRAVAPENSAAWASLTLLGMLPMLFCDPRIPLFSVTRVLLGIAPFSGLVGYLTPGLVDRWSGGDPDRAAGAYAINVLGCILGPLVSGFILLPHLRESWTLLLFCVPWVWASSSGLRWPTTKKWMLPPAVRFGTLTIILILSCKTFETSFPSRHVLRDSTATVLAAGEGMQKRLLVNGVGMTTLTPITKVMAHFPSAMLDRRPQNALIICFGMGTTYRSFLSWGIPTTAVELVPSVPKLFWYYHPDAPEILGSPLSHIVVDDGRRYLERISEKFDVIAIDPPPPVEAAGSSLLYSQDFYSEIKKHLRAGGILQQWLPEGDAVVRSSVARAISQSFSYVRVFRSVDNSGFHFLASDSPLPSLTSQELAAKLPEAAGRDFVEWGPATTAQGQFEILLRNEIPLQQMIADAPDAPALDDDRPTNEYFAWRSVRSRGVIGTLMAEIAKQP